MKQNETTVLVKVRPPLRRRRNVVAFALRTDTVTGLNEGDIYEQPEDGKGIVNLNMWASPKLADHQVYVCFGKEAIDEGYERYLEWIGANDTRR